MRMQRRGDRDRVAPVALAVGVLDAGHEVLDGVHVGAVEGRQLADLGHELALQALHALVVEPVEPLDGELVAEGELADDRGLAGTLVSEEDGHVVELAPGV